MLIHEDQILSLSLFSSRLCFPLPIISSLPIPIIFYFSSSHRIAIHLTIWQSMKGTDSLKPKIHGQQRRIIFSYHNGSIWCRKQGRTNSRAALCWWPLSHVLTVNFSGINWVLHDVPCIFYLILISSTSFGWVVLAGIHCPKMVEIRENPGRLLPL